MNSQFVHLDVKSAYNYRFDSLIRIENLIQQAKRNGMNAVAITDESVLHSAVDFYILAKENNVKPIIGITMDIWDEKGNGSVKVVLLAKSYQGYRNIVKISSLSHLRRTANNYITVQEFKKYCGETVVMLDVESYLNKAEIIVKEYVRFLPKEDLYIMMKDFNLPHQKAMNKKLHMLSQSSGIKLVATNDVHYFAEKEAKARNVLRLIQNPKQTLTSESNQKYFKSEKEMKQLFSLYPEALKNTIEIAEKCNVTLRLKGEEGFINRLPDFPIPKEFLPPKTLNGKFDILPNFQKPKTKYEVVAISFLCYLAERGFEKIFGNNEEAMKRLRYELGVIISKGFTNYFLIVQDFVKYAKVNEISVGPGRGSAAGSLLSFCLGITDVSPIQYNLMFERFLNPERFDDPDIDIDFSKELRYKLFQYAQKKYGVGSTAKIITFNNYGGKLAIRDVGRVLKVNAQVIEQLATNIETSVKELATKKNLVKKLMEKEQKTAELIEYASMIEGLPRNRSVHAAGLVLSEGHLSDGVPVMVTDDDETGKPILITQIHKDLLETIGYTKIDFLGLRNLDIIEKVKKEVKKTKNIDLTHIPLDDKKTFELYQRGETLGVFQMDSKQMRKTSVQVKPTKIEDIFPLIALFRPGSMDMIPIYAKNRENNEFVIYDLNEVYDEEKKRMVKEFVPFEKDVAILKPILDETYGVIVYQEQIIKIVQVWAGFTLGEADLLRRAISKKKKNVIDEKKEVFLSKSAEMKRDVETSERLYDLIVKFANYGFNVPHSAAYGILSYQTAYLKTNFPLEFMSASISSLMDEIEKAADYIKETIRMGITVQKPNINSSTVGFDVDGETLLFGLAMIKNVGEKAAETIVAERKKGRFTSFDNFMQRVHSKDVNKKCIESLIKVGAFDEFGSRKSLKESVDTKKKRNPLLNQQIIFDEIPGVGSDEVITILQTDEYSVEERINYEVQLTGVVFTKYLVLRYQEEVEKTVETLNKLEKSQNKWIGGSIIAKKVIRDSNGNEMAFLKLSDGQKETDITMFHDKWNVFKNELQMYHLYLIQVNEKNGKYSVRIIRPMKEKNQMTMEIPEKILLSEEETKTSWMKQLATIINNHQGVDEFVLKIGESEKKYSILLSGQFVKDLQLLQVKKENIKFGKVRYE